MTPDKDQSRPGSALAMTVLFTMVIIFGYLDLIGSMPQHKDTTGFWSWPLFAMLGVAFPAAAIFVGVARLDPKLIVRIKRENGKIKDIESPLVELFLCGVLLAAVVTVLISPFV